MRALRPAESRLLAWLLALLALGLAYLLLVHWWFVAPQLDIHAQMRDLRQQQQRLVSVIAQRTSLRQRLATLSRGQADNAAFLPEQDENAASVGLMQRVVDAVATHTAAGPCKVTQKMPVTLPADQQPYRKVSASISLQCAIAPLAAVLHDLEKGTPYLFIDTFGVYRTPNTSENGMQPPLQVQMTLSGYLRGSRGATP